MKSKKVLPLISLLFVALMLFSIGMIVKEHDILSIVARKYEFEYPDDKMTELSKRIKIFVDDKARYTDWSTRDDIKANLQVDLILLLDEFDYPPVTIDDVYKEVLEQTENFKKYAD